MGGVGKAIGNSKQRRGDKWRNGTTGADITNDDDAPNADNVTHAIHSALGAIADFDERLSNFLDSSFTGQLPYGFVLKPDIGGDTNVLGKFNPSNGYIYIATAVHDKSSIPLFNNRKERFGVTSSMVGTAVHEISHAIAIKGVGGMRLLHTKDMYESVTYRLQQVISTAYKKAVKDKAFVGRKKDFSFSISRYASVNAHETVAEAFTDMVLTKGKGRVASKYIMNELMNNIGEL